MTGLGCAKGGFPYCPNLDQVYFCKDGTTCFRNDLLKYQLAGRKDCICPDGISPRCISDNDLVKCPDGSYPDPSVGKPGEYYNGCSEEYFEVPKEWARDKSVFNKKPATKN